MESSILLELERAELAARERRLAAEADAERVLADARSRAAALQAEVEPCIADAIEARCLELEAEADREIASVDAQLTGLAARGMLSADDRLLRQAVQLVVRAVLAEGSDEEG